MKRKFITTFLLSIFILSTSTAFEKDGAVNIDNIKIEEICINKLSYVVAVNVNGLAITQVFNDLNFADQPAKPKRCNSSGTPFEETSEAKQNKTIFEVVLLIMILAFLAALGFWIKYSKD